MLRPASSSASCRSCQSLCCRPVAHLSLKASMRCLLSLVGRTLTSSGRSSNGPSSNHRQQSEVTSGIGDVYELLCGDQQVAFMQHILTDNEQMGSAVVRVFAGIHDQTAPPALEQVVQEATKFHSHILPAAGKTLGLWRRVGRVDVEPLPCLTWFTPPPKRIRDKECDEWRVWDTNMPPETVISSDPRLGYAEFGAVMAPDQLIERVRTGQWSFPCPAPLGKGPWSFVSRCAT